MALIPIFISSTFQDFHRERDELVATVLPMLNDRAVEFGCRVEIADLRWGVTVEDADVETRQNRVLQVCLSEIERTRPLFVGLLGDRFGWVPEPHRLRLAAQEARITDYDPEWSVTALEFEFGALRGPDSVSGARRWRDRSAGLTNCPARPDRGNRRPFSNSRRGRDTAMSTSRLSARFSYFSSK
ncbi:DUF4062 domain-containing protein [Nocardia sp. NPDC047654]|uniref:DUF4062 domain-containing protein n=1 Tax=Nocardia sp. NPDC047654 TaxID=3364314 RepID=UPI00370FC566